MSIAIISAVVFILFCPILFNINLHFNIKNKKLYAGIHLYKVIKIFGGTLELKKGGILIKYGKKEALLNYFEAFKKNTANLKILKGFDLIKIHLVTECGIQDDTIKALTLVSFVHILKNIVFSVLRTFNSALSLKGVEILEQNRDVFTLTAGIKYVFNLFLLILAFLKIILKGVINYVERKREQTGQYGRHGNEKSQ